MKFKYILIVLLFVFACSNPKSEQEVENPAQPPQNISSTSTHALLKKIMGNGQGLLRGFNFGDDIGFVKRTEKLELFEHEKTHLGYTFDTPDLETVDILYGRDDKGKVSWIQLDIYMNSDSLNEELFAAFNELFDLKYGKMTEVEGHATWKLSPEGTVTVKKVKTNLDRGLEVRFVK